MSAPKVPDGHRLGQDQLLPYLVSRGYADAEIIGLAPLGELGRDGVKSYGYGKPLHVRFESAGKRHDWVIRTMKPDPFGHDRRSDRWQVLSLAFDTFDRFPNHVTPFDVGAIDETGRLVSAPRGEPFLVTSYAEGQLYADDLRRLAPRAEATALDRARAETLAEYLAGLHQERGSPEAYLRSVRDTIGHGEGIFGLVDSYPPDHPVATRARLEQLELGAVRWRRKLACRSHRARRVHGDFHPFNLLFGSGTELSVLDASRGGVGDPADDVCCLAINYLFFALLAGRERLGGAPAELWHAFWKKYLEATGDRELLEVVPLYFTWRVLVVASPVWYPDVSAAARSRLLTFAERLLDGAPFHPDRMEALLR